MGESMRPKSMMWFDIAFLGSLVAQGASLAVAWEANRGQLPVFGTGIAVSLLLWFFVSHWGSNVARWLLALLVGAQVLVTASALLSAAFWSSPGGLLIALSLVLQVAAIVFLFRPETRPWFTAPIEAA